VSASLSDLQPRQYRTPIATTIFVGAVGVVVLALS
jgi:hypothetical protein